MAALPSQFPISLRSWPSANSDDELPSIISRINSERGGFLNITEESLRHEIEEELNNNAGSSSSSEDEEEPGTVKKVTAARDQLILDLEYVQHAVTPLTDKQSADEGPDTPIKMRALPWM